MTERISAVSSCHSILSMTERAEVVAQCIVADELNATTVSSFVNRPEVIYDQSNATES